MDGSPARTPPPSHTRSHQHWSTCVGITLTQHDCELIHAPNAPTPGRAGSNPYPGEIERRLEVALAAGPGSIGTETVVAGAPFRQEVISIVEPTGLRPTRLCRCDASRMGVWSIAITTSPFKRPARSAPEPGFRSDTTAPRLSTPSF